MSGLEEQLNSILSDPAQMERIAGLARSLVGEGGAQPEPPQEAPGFDAALLQKLGRAVKGGGGGREQALLQAMEPYLSEKRRGKLERAMKLARLARVARFAMLETGGGDDQPL